MPYRRSAVTRLRLDGLIAAALNLQQLPADLPFSSTSTHIPFPPAEGSG